MTLKSTGQVSIKDPDTGIAAKVATVSGENRLYTQTAITATNGSVPTINGKLRYDDMNASNGGIARGTLVTNAAFVNIYSYTGTGMLFSFLVNIEEKNNWQIRLIVDGEDVFFGSTGLITGELVNDAIYDLDDAGSPLSPNEGNFGLSLEEHDRFVFNCPNGFPIRYSTSVVVKVKRLDAQVSKKFNAGIIILTKE